MIATGEQSDLTIISQMRQKFLRSVRSMTLPSVCPIHYTFASSLLLHVSCAYIFRAVYLYSTCLCDVCLQVAGLGSLAILAAIALMASVRQTTLLGEGGSTAVYRGAEQSMMP